MIQTLEVHADFSHYIEIGLRHLMPVKMVTAVVNLSSRCPYRENYSATPQE